MSGPWHFKLPLLPPSQNHATLPNGKGGRYMTVDARSRRNAFMLAARGAGFHPTLQGTYRVSIAFVMPDWRRDLDGPLKMCLDAMFIDGRYDHRIVKIEASKRIVRGRQETDVWIEELTDDHEGQAPTQGPPRHR